MARKQTKAVATGKITDMAEKLKALDVTMAHLEKDFGSGTVMRLGDDAVKDVETIPTGSITLDYALGGWSSAWQNSGNLWYLNLPEKPRSPSM